MEGFLVEVYGGGVVAHERGPVGALVDEVLLRAEEVCWEEDVGAEGGEEGVEVGGGGGAEGRECACYFREEGELLVWFLSRFVGGNKRACTVLFRCSRRGEGAVLPGGEAAETGATAVEDICG